MYKIISWTHLNLCLLLPLFITWLAGCKQQSVWRDDVTVWRLLMGLHNAMVSFVRQWVHWYNVATIRCILFLCHDGLSFWWVVFSTQSVVQRSTPTCLHWQSSISSEKDGAAGIGEGSSSRRAASTANPQALVWLGVENGMTRKDILFTTPATYCIRDVHRLLFTCCRLGRDVFSSGRSCIYIL